MRRHAHYGSFRARTAMSKRPPVEGGPNSPPSLRPGRNGVVPPPEHRWRPGQSGNPSGRPKGYVDPTQAYVLVSALPYPDALLLMEGKRPTGWHQKQPSAAYVRAARELLSTRGNAAEINARMEGPLKQVVERQGDEDAETKAILAVLATLPPPPAARRTADDEKADAQPGRHGERD